MTWRRRARRAPAVEAAPPPARERGAAEVFALAIIREELVELADRIPAVLGSAGRPVRHELLTAAGRVDGAIAEINRGAGR